MPRVNPLVAVHLARSLISRLMDESPTCVIQTWCRICGESVLLELPWDYEGALDECYLIDDEAALIHEGHIERGGWGMHFRLDDVLRTMFPEQHLEPHWVIPPWYTARMALDEEVVILSGS